MSTQLLFICILYFKPKYISNIANFKATFSMLVLFHLMAKATSVLTHLIKFTIYEVSYLPTVVPPSIDKHSLVISFAKSEAKKAVAYAMSFPL